MALRPARAAIILAEVAMRGRTTARSPDGGNKSWELVREF
jgi:hypothetical protein